MVGDIKPLDASVAGLGLFRSDPEAIHPRVPSIHLIRSIYHLFLPQNGDGVVTPGTGNARIHSERRWAGRMPPPSGAAGRVPGFVTAVW